MAAKRLANKSRATLTNDELAALRVDDYARLRLTDEEKARMRLINQERSRKRAEWASRLRIEEEPILADLRLIGWDVTSVWDLVNTSTPYPDAIPILFKHLTLGYSDRTKEGIARALAVPDAKNGWSLLVDEYCKAPMGEENGIRLDAKSGLAVALAATATADVIAQLASLAKDASNGDSRLLLLTALRKSKTAVAKRTLEELADDPALHKEIASWRRKR